MGGQITIPNACNLTTAVEKTLEVVDLPACSDITATSDGGVKAQVTTVKKDDAFSHKETIKTTVTVSVPSSGSATKDTTTEKTSCYLREGMGNGYSCSTTSSTVSVPAGNATKTNVKKAVAKILGQEDKSAPAPAPKPQPKPQPQPKSKE